MVRQVTSFNTRMILFFKFVMCARQEVIIWVLEVDCDRAELIDVGWT